MPKPPPAAADHVIVRTPGRSRHGRVRRGRQISPRLCRQSQMPLFMDTHPYFAQHLGAREKKSPE